MTINPFGQTAFETHAHACTFPTDGRPAQIAAVAYEVRGLATTFRPSGTVPGLDDALETLGWRTATEMGGAVRPLPGWTAHHTDGQLIVTMPGGTWYTGPLPSLDDVPAWFHLARSRGFIMNVAGTGVMTAGHGFFMNAERVRYTAVPFTG
jgi:hypothetical protein